MSLYEADEVPVATLIDSDTKRSIDITVTTGLAAQPSQCSLLRWLYQ